MDDLLAGIARLFKEGDGDDEEEAEELLDDEEKEEEADDSLAR